MKVRDKTFPNEPERENGNSSNVRSFESKC